MFTKRRLYPQALESAVVDSMICLFRDFPSLAEGVPLFAICQGKAKEAGRLGDYETPWSHFKTPRKNHEKQEIIRKLENMMKT